MTLKHMFLSTAAASSLLLAVAAVEPAVFSLATKAQAATNISVSINFYDDLAPYGNWVSYHDRYVWIPEDVDAHWRPYTEGHWAYTRRYGWIWVSDERFGWATYHYGRWGFGRDIGWYWVPGRRWAPAWVAWSYDDYDIAWAPLPPDHYDDVNIVIYIPDYYWQAVSVSAFLSVDLSSHMFRDRDRVRRVIQRGESWTVRIEDDIIVNNVIEIDNIEKRTKKKVVALEEKAVDNPDAAGKADSNSVTIFNSEVKEETNAKPKKTRKIEEVVKEREAKGVPDEEQPSGRAATTTDEPVTKPKKDEATDAVVPQDEQQNADQPAPTEKKKKDTASADQPDVEETVNVPAEEQMAPADKKKKKDAAAPDQPDVEETVNVPADEQAAPVDKKKKKDAAAPDQPDVEETVNVPAEEQAAPVDKKKKDTASTDQPDVEETVNVPAEEQAAPIENKKKKKAEQPVNTGRKGQPECEPAVADCPPAQTLSKLKHQSTKRVISKTNLPDAGAESWRVNCSSRFGGFNKASETYLSSAGKRVSCARPPLKKMASAALPREITSQASGTSWAIQLASVRDPNEAKAEWRRLLGRFKDLLEGKKLTVVRAHLGERGIFYRLRIGGFQHKSSAVMLCDSIKAKGGNCLAILIRQSNAE